MSRIKKRGLDYFPLNTDFIQNRIVRRIMKRNGDGALATLLAALSCIYADEGYYVRADELFYEDLSAGLYDTTIDKVKSILAQAMDYGFFDIVLFREYGILTSAEIQRQYLFSTKRRKASAIDPRFCLIDDPQTDAENDTDAENEANEDHSSESESATLKPQNVTSGTHSIAQHSIEKHSIAQESKANSLLNSSPQTGGTEGADGTSTEEDSLYNKKIATMQPPQDGQEHNLDGLIFNLRQFRISPQEQYAIILKSNFGVIGHPMWKGFYALRESHGKIRQPGRYLLSLCNK
ncbi:DUF4373 domain-containing protein [Bacteroides sp.]|uniref:DUF4373 domain-containing protein n=1 Tax=Bacteroides sp. TaxID=29523 RepID=UPI002611C99D|nr:DUF4373 domain-containing protein [Bacteroides sp.]